MKYLTNKQIEEIKNLRFLEESFDKFDNPAHPQYEDYKDRTNEKWHDRGYNNAIEQVMTIMGRL